MKEGRGTARRATAIKELPAERLDCALAPSPGTEPGQPPESRQSRSIHGRERRTLPSIDEETRYPGAWSLHAGARPAGWQLPTRLLEEREGIRLRHSDRRCRGPACGC